MKEIYNGQTVALGGPNLVTKELVVDDSTGEKAKFTYDKTTGAIAVQDEVDEDSVNPVTSRAVAKAIEQGGGGGGTTYTAGDGIAIENDEISAKVDGTTIGVNESGELEALGGGGGGDILTVVYDVNDLPEGQEIDDIAAEISAAVAAGKSVQLLDVNENIVANLSAIDSDFSWAGPTFMSPVDRDENLVNYFKEYHLGTDQFNRGWSVNTNYVSPQIPAPTSDDENKVAVVVGKNTEWGSDYMAYEPKNATSLINVGLPLQNNAIEAVAQVYGSGDESAYTDWTTFTELKINGSGASSLAQFSGDDEVILKVTSKTGGVFNPYYSQVRDTHNIIDTSGKSEVCVWVATWNDKESQMEYTLLGPVHDNNDNTVMFEFVESGHNGVSGNYFKIDIDGKLSATVDAILGPDWAASVQTNDYAYIFLGTQYAPLDQGEWLSVSDTDNSLALDVKITKVTGYRLDLKRPSANGNMVLASKDKATPDWVPSQTLSFLNYNENVIDGSDAKYIIDQAKTLVQAKVPWSSFTGSYSSGSIPSTGSIFMPLASARVSGNDTVYTFFLFDGANKLSVTLTATQASQYAAPTYVWGTPTIAQ